jgi:hypothetical protein
MSGVGLDILWRHQPDRVSVANEGASQEVCATARLHGDNAGRKCSRECNQRFMADFPTQHHGTTDIKRRHAAAVLAQVDPVVSSRAQ